MHNRVTMNDQKTTSRSYLLRLWLAGAAEPAVWRASLEHVQTGERLGFANLEQMFVFLMQQTEHEGEAPDAKSES
jgi:hypothetical protein